LEDIKFAKNGSKTEKEATSEDIKHYQRIVVALQSTIEIMDKIDKAIPGFPII
jgi:hypothetical protein